MRGGPKRRSGERSNSYSRSKFSNWMRFDPFSLEVKAVRRRGTLKPVLRMDEIDLPIFSVPLHPLFLRPCTAADVLNVLSKVPRRFLPGLSGVYLLGGSAKQAVAANGSLFRFGCYMPGYIFLHAFPRDGLSLMLTSGLKPSTIQEYRRAGARVATCGDKSEVLFDEESLRRFYLFDVLLHEVAHHVDKHVFERPNRDAERFAEWFVQERNRCGRLGWPFEPGGIVA